MLREEVWELWLLLVEPSLATTNKQVSKGMEKHPIIKITVVFWKGFDW